ncbi:pyridoxal kinase PdxY [Corynebacterium halotolerans]|uniref:pyridoxal kinase n=1 Tax=Corynebacterium halotolerans YIM 70093 = DSM 44683 TaxID=1121362 RepID=M1MZF5_9CORY|nr:pyridoxal kinase PdxY [Corynebacterium halotolerans]AGF73079.1 pyridoxamine kinase [Corynebacterium halotolerans YIM 70093 = DSM 44683]
MNILSIQSAVAYGHVGNAGAVFPLQRLGHEVWPVHTVNFSNHTAYDTVRGREFSAAQVADVILGIEELGVFGEIDVVLSGYQGGHEIAEVITDTVARVRQVNPNAVYSCDPVMGNAVFGRFVAEEIPELMRSLVVPAADILTPNQWELGVLTGRQGTDLATTLAAVESLRQAGPRAVLVTSVQRPDRPAGTVEMLAVDDRGAWIVRTPHVPRKFVGTGDVAAALFTGHYVSNGDAADALARTASSMFDLITATDEAGSEELKLVESQEYYVRPRMQFEVERV